MVPRPWRHGCGECGEAATHTDPRGWRCWTHALPEGAPPPPQVPLQRVALPEVQRIFSLLPRRPEGLGRSS